MLWVPTSTKHLLYVKIQAVSIQQGGEERTTVVVVTKHEQDGGDNGSERPQ